ncbi:hypothetical protein [Rhodopirellula europaea]|uniref:hypothetical protein n=1 Tax=Rhodopirellula europaea TaxID=1263866 RepID=UPI003D26CEB0
MQRNPPRPVDSPRAPDGAQTILLSVSGTYQHDPNLTPPWKQLGYSGYRLVQHMEHVDRLSEWLAFAALLSGLGWLLCRLLTSHLQRPVATEINE